MTASASPAFAINGGSPGIKASVSASGAVVAVLDDITGVKTVAWRLASTDESADPTDYVLVQTGSVGQTCSTTALTAGTAAILECIINGGVDTATGLTNLIVTKSTAKFYVPAANGLEVSCAQEGYESDATYGWTGELNAAIRAAGGGSAYPFTAVAPPVMAAASAVGANVTSLTRPDHTHGFGVLSGHATATDGATVTFNFANGPSQQVTLAGNRTVAVSNLRAGALYALHIIQDGTGSRTLTWPATAKFQGGVAPTLTTAASAHDLIIFSCDGTNLYELNTALGLA